METKINSRILYQGKIFTLTQDDVAISNGSIHSKDIIHHNGGCAILAQRENQVLLISQYRYAMGEELYEIPAGKIEGNEDPYKSALREFEEETGYSCQQLEWITTIYPSPGFCTEKIHIYNARQIYTPAHRRAMDEDECIEVHWIDLKQAYRWIQDGKIRDAKTIIALQHALLND